MTTTHAPASCISSTWRPMLLLAALAAAVPATAPAQSYFNVTSGTWSVLFTPSTPTAGGSSEYTLIFTNKSSATINSTNDLGTPNFILNQILFTNASQNLVIFGGGTTSLVFTNTAAGVLPQIVQTTGKTLTFNHALQLATNLTFAGAGTATVAVNSNVTGTGSLSMFGAYQLTLAGANSYAGGTIVNAGKVLFNVAGALPASGLVLVNQAGVAATAFAMNQTFVNSLSNTSSGVIALGASGGSGNNLDLSVNGGLSNVWFGATTASTYSGVLTAGGANYLLGGGGTALTINHATAAALTGSVGVVIGNSATVSLMSSNSYSGGTLVSNGVLRVGPATALGGGGANVTIAAGAILAASNALDQAVVDRINPASAGLLALAVNSDNSLNLSGAGPVSLGATRAAVYGGLLTPYGTTYRLGGGGASLTLTNNLALTGSRDVVINNVGLNGMVVLAGSNDYTGVTTVLNSITPANNTPLIVSNSAAFGQGSVLFTNSVANGSTYVNFNFGGGTGSLAITNALTLDSSIASRMRLVSTSGSNILAGPLTLRSSAAGGAAGFEGNGLGANGSWTILGDIDGTQLNGAAMYMSGAGVGSGGYLLGSVNLGNHSINMEKGGATRSEWFIGAPGKTYVWRNIQINGILHLLTSGVLPTNSYLNSTHNGDMILDLNGTTQRISYISTSTFTGNLITNYSATPAALTLTGTAATPGIFTGTVAENPGGGTISLAVAGGLMSLVGTNTCSGGTAVTDGGLLLVSLTNSFGSGPLSIATGAGVGPRYALDQPFLDWVNATAGTVGPQPVIALGANSTSNLSFSGSLSNGFLGAAGAVYSYGGSATWPDAAVRLGGGNSNLVFSTAVGTGTNLLVGPMGGNALSLVALTNAAHNPDSTTIQSGTLQVGNNGAGTLGTGTVGIAAGAVLSFYPASGENTNTSDVISGGGSVLLKNANGAVVMLASNAYSGGTTLTSGNATVRVGDDSALGTGPVTFAANGTLTGAGAGTRTLGNSLVIAANPTLGAASANTGALIFNGGVDLGGTTRVLTVSSPVTFNGAVGNGALTKLGNSALFLNGPNTYAGPTVIGAGILQADFGTGLPAASSLVVTGGAWSSASGLISTAVGSGTGQVSLPGGSGGFSAYNTPLTVNLNGDTGTVVWGTADFNPAALVLNVAAANTNLTFLNGLDLNGANRTISVQTTDPGAAATLAGVVVGNATFIKGGAGTLLLATNAAHTGGTLVNGGTLQIGILNALPTTSALTLGDTTGGGGLFLDSFNQTVGSFAVGSTNTTATNVVAIGAGRTLTVNGNVTIGQDLANSTAAVLTMGGAGSFVVNTNGGIFQVGAGNTGGGVRATADLSALATANINLGAGGTLYIGDTKDTGTGSNGVNTAMLLLASNTTVTAGTLMMADSGRNKMQTLVLSSGTNVLNVDTINVGGPGTYVRDNAQVYFGSGGGSLAIRAADGTGRAALNIGVQTSGSGYPGGYTVDLTGHNADLLLGTLTVGENLRHSLLTNTFSFNQGILDATALRIGNKMSGMATFDNDQFSTANLGGGAVTIGSGIVMGTTYGTSGTRTNYATLNISDGTVSVTGGVTMLTQRSNFGVANSAFNITGGAVTLQGDVVTGIGSGTAGHNATFTLNGGSLDLQGYNLGGSANASNNLDVLNFQSGTLLNVGQINTGAPLVKTTGGVLTLGGTSGYTGGTTLGAGTIQLGGNNVLGSGTLAMSGGKLASDGVSPRALTNSLRITTASGFGDAVNNGLLTLSGDIDFAAASRTLTNYSDIVFSGSSGNGGLGIKLGPGSMAFQGGIHDWTDGAALQVKDGTLVFDGAIVTNQDAFRAMSIVAYGTARLVVTNGAVLVCTNAAANIRLGYSSNATATNILDVAGRITMNTSGTAGEIQMGNTCAKAIANLLPGGELEVGAVVKTDNVAEFNFAGGILRARESATNFMSGLDAAYVRAGGAIIDSAGYDVTVGQALLDGGGNGGLTTLGTGTLQLGAANSYRGATVVSNGTLLLTATGSISNSSALRLVSLTSTADVSAVVGGFHLLAGQQVAGLGTVKGGLIMDAGSSLSPGNSAGTLNVSGSLTLAGGAGTTNYFELALDGLSDRVNVSGGLDLNGVQFTDFAFTLGGGPLASNATFTLVHADGGVSGALGAVTNGPVGSYTGYLSQSANELQLTVIPEPGTVGMLGLFAAAALLRRRLRG